MRLIGFRKLAHGSPGFETNRGKNGPATMGTCFLFIECLLDSTESGEAPIFHSDSPCSGLIAHGGFCGEFRLNPKP